jgi:AcrR family transcriptional regulator
MTRVGPQQRVETRAPRPGLVGTRKVPRAVREPQMLEMAGRVFAQRGFHAASMDEIAEAAGISKPMLYNYFGSKEGLYFAFVDLSYRDVIFTIDAAVAEEVARGGSPAEQLRAGTRAYYRYVGEHRDAFRVLFREMGDPGGQLKQPRRRLRRRVAAAIEGILADRGATADRLLGTDAMAEAFLGAARGLADWWLDQSEWSATDVGDRLMDLMLVGLEDLTRR